MRRLTTRINPAAATKQLGPLGLTGDCGLSWHCGAAFEHQQAQQCHLSFAVGV